MSLYNEGRKIGKIGGNVGADSPSTGTVAGPERMQWGARERKRDQANERRSKEGIN